MKKVLTPITAALVLSAFVFTACQTGPTPSPGVVVAAPLITSTTAGAIIVGAEQDTNTLTYARAARNVILSMISTNTLGPDLLQAQLSAIRIQGFNPQVQALIVAGVVGIYESYLQQLAVNGVNSNADAVAILNAIVAGIDRGIAASMPPPLPGTRSVQVDKGQCVKDWYHWRAQHPNLK